MRTHAHAHVPPKWSWSF